MSNGDDVPEACCAAGICCGGDDDKKQIAALKKIILSHIGQHGGLDEAILYLIDHWDLYPKSWGVGAALEHVALVARSNPYQG